MLSSFYRKETVTDKNVFSKIMTSTLSLYSTGSDSFSLMLMEVLTYKVAFFYLLKVALYYIGKRGSIVDVAEEKRIKCAKEILKKEMLSRLGKLSISCMFC
ncbi:hypothetical protein C5167_049704 [Papaver somniferum]|uniref:Uncharacterized protein n=1 Tax=Papaver somniferum TaxID=3469 RepID=A0A4Y7KQK3_PAPSO|nr:hypothetical protein C5167_049704 [Papaver somniferum]